MAKRLYAKILDYSSNMKSLVDIVFYYYCLKDVEKRHKKSFLMRVCEHFRASASYLLKYISLNSDSARLLKSFRCFERYWFHSYQMQADVSRLDVLDDEWKLKQIEKDPDLAATTRVDEYGV